MWRRAECSLQDEVNSLVASEPETQTTDRNGVIFLFWVALVSSTAFAHAPAVQLVSDDNLSCMHAPANAVMMRYEWLMMASVPSVAVYCCPLSLAALPHMIALLPMVLGAVTPSAGR